MPQIRFRRGRYQKVEWTWDGDVRTPGGRWKCRLQTCQDPAQGRLRFYCSAQHRQDFQRWLWSQLPAMDWATVRVNALERDGYKCVQCGATERLEVDHIKPVAKYPELEFCLENTRTLCHECHARFGARPNHPLWRAAHHATQQRL